MTRSFKSISRVSAILVFLLPEIMGLGSTEGLRAQSMDPRYYDIGKPTLTEVWVDPVNGNDNNSGASRDQALRTVSAAWEHIPSGTALNTTGYRINLVTGTYNQADVPEYWDRRYGTYNCPVIIQAVDGSGTARVPPMNIYDCRYLYLVGLNFQGGTSENTLHGERLNHFLVRQCTVTGAEPETFAVQEVIKVNQSQYVYIEDSDVSGAWGTVIDFVAVQYGHIQGNKIHNAGDWCLYIKGGSAYHRIEGNELYDGEAGGFTAGQGTGFEFMVSPWLHYEAYDIKFINNIIHDIEGAGFGANGGYNILLAFNTLYRVGRRSHVIEVVHGRRNCWGNVKRCKSLLKAGGWGTATIGGDEPIPDRNIYISNNVIYNPSGYQSQWKHFAIYGPSQPSRGTNIPSPASTDTNLRIRGNVIWNGPKNHPLGIEDSDQGCRPANPTCNQNQLRADNSINKVQPQLVNPEQGDFHPAAGGNLFNVTTYAIPNFSGTDRPKPPLAPKGNLTNSISRDYANATRSSTTPPGAYVSSNSAGSKR